jgi:predicted transporter
MNRLLTLMAGVVTLGLYFVIAPVVTDTYRRFRKRKTLICPDTGQIAEVELKAVQAGIMSALGKHWVRVKWCSLWPRKKDCAQECIKEDWWSRE